MKVQEIPGKMTSVWESDVNAVLDIWTSYSISLDEFKEAILIKGLPFAKSHGGKAWIIDSSKAKGVFPQDIQQYIGSDILPAFNRNGIKFLITIKPEVIGLTSMTVSSYSSKVGPAGIKLVDVSSVADAKMWLKAHGND